MKNIFCVALFLLSFSHSKAADTLVNKLINSIYLETVESTAKFYYLLDSAKNPEFDNYDLIDLKNEYSKSINEIPFNDFISNIKKRSLKFLLEKP